MHPTVVLLGEKQIAIHLLQGGNHPVAAGLIQRAHLFQVTEKMPFVEKRGEDLLRQHRLAAGGDVRAVGKGPDGAGGHQHVAHAQRRHNGFTEGAHKNHPVVLAGPVEQLLFTRQRERDRQRTLVRRGDDGKSGVAMVAQQVVRVDAAAIDRHGVQARHDPLEQLLAHKITRIFKHHLVAAAGEGVEDQPQAAAVAAGDQHLLGGAGQAARDVEVAGDGLAQRIPAQHRRVEHLLLTHGPRRLARQQQPLFIREAVEGGDAGAQKPRPLALADERGRKRTGGLLRRGMLVRQQEVRVNPRAARPLAHQIPFTRQNGIRRFDGFTRHLQLFRQHADGRYPVARLQHAAHNVVAIAGINLVIARLHVLPHFTIFVSFYYVMNGVDLPHRMTHAAQKEERP
ncbi:Uncharacterised protein [Klebsiella pneumoniae]|nr:Uncharacterised protein [Klebsiella pneumoniae]